MAVFLLNKSGQHLIGYSSEPQSPKGSQGVVMVLFFILLESSTTEAEIRAVAKLFTEKFNNKSQ